MVVLGGVAVSNERGTPVAAVVECQSVHNDQAIGMPCMLHVASVVEYQFAHNDHVIGTTQGPSNLKSQFRYLVNFGFVHNDHAVGVPCMLQLRPILC